jgi:hypothetical protein
MLLRIVKAVRSNSHLPQPVDAIGSPCRFSRGLNRRQQQRDQDANDRNYDQ